MDKHHIEDHYVKKVMIILQRTTGSNIQVNLREIVGTLSLGIDSNGPIS